MNYEQEYQSEVKEFNSIYRRFEKLQENDIHGAYRLMVDSLQAYNRWSKIRQDIRKGLSRGQASETKDRLEDINRYLISVYTTSRMVWNNAKDDYKTTREESWLIVVEGKIKGKARPRVFQGHAITPKDTVNYENWVKMCYQQQGGIYLDGSIKAKIKVYYKIPKSYSKTKTLDCSLGILRPTKKPDIDNVAKIILDSLNGVAYNDDSQIVELEVTKLWTEDIERVEFSLKEILEE